MVEERDMLALSLPFTAGVALGGLLAPSYLWAFVADASLLLFLLLFLKFTPRDILLFAALMLLCGFLCGSAGGLCALSSCTSDDGFFSLLRSSLARQTDSLPFSGGDTPSLVKALALGDRSGLSVHVRSVFRESGASHILALSGLHLGIFYLSLSRILSPLGRSPLAKRVKSLIIILLSLFYVALAGAGSSLVRALLFIILRESAMMLHRKISLLRLLLVSLMLQLMITPSEILSAGFELSYLAVAGLAVLQPFLEGFYPSDGADRFNLPRRLWQMCCVSISCQAFTAPVAWLRFGSLPKYFLLSNILALPLATVTTWISMLIVLLSAMGECPRFLIGAADFVGGLLVWVLETVSGM